MTSTNNLDISFLDISVKDKETAINEGFQRVDALMNTGAISRVLTTPPASPANGDLYIIPSGATGVWGGQTGKMAFYHSNWGWVFTTPREGMQLWVNNEDVMYVFNGSAWVLASAGSITYAAGSFTPSVAGGTVAGTATYSARQGSYTRIGNRVFVDIYLNYSGGTGSGQLQVTGLPFASTNYASGSVPYTQSIATGSASTYPMGIITPGSTTIIFFAEPVAGGGAPNCNYDSGGEILFSINYQIA